jgi:PilZ domain
MAVGTGEPSSKRISHPSAEDENAERRGRRVPIQRRLFFFGDNEFEGEASVLDISTNGCRATSLTDVKVGLLLKLSLFLQDQQWPLRIDEAVVRWVDGQSFGLEFIGIRPAQRERLRALIMKMKP